MGEEEAVRMGTYASPRRVARSFRTQNACCQSVSKKSLSETYDPGRDTTFKTSSIARFDGRGLATGGVATALDNQPQVVGSGEIDSGDDVLGRCLVQSAEA
jgi:hypothetical protein